MQMRLRPCVGGFVFVGFLSLRVAPEHERVWGGRAVRESTMKEYVKCVNEYVKCVNEYVKCKKEYV